MSATTVISLPGRSSAHYRWESHHCLSPTLWRFESGLLHKVTSSRTEANQRSLQKNISFYNRPQIQFNPKGGIQHRQCQTDLRQLKHFNTALHNSLECWFIKTFTYRPRRKQAALDEQNSHSINGLLQLSSLDSREDLWGAELPSGHSRTARRCSSGFSLNTMNKKNRQLIYTVYMYNVF